MSIQCMVQNKSVNIIIICNIFPLTMSLENTVPLSTARTEWNSVNVLCMLIFILGQILLNVIVDAIIMEKAYFGQL